MVLVILEKVAEVWDLNEVFSGKKNACLVWNQDRILDGAKQKLGYLYLDQGGFINKYYLDWWVAVNGPAITYAIHTTHKMN